MKKLLVFASTFPRWKRDTIPPFVYELSKRLAVGKGFGGGGDFEGEGEENRLTKDFDVHVLAPAYPGAKREEVMGVGR